jgi:ferredoxin
MARLLSVNVALPRKIAWRGKTVYTTVWKEPEQGRRLVRRLNIDGDAQGDLAGHGGEHRAVYVYQTDSCHYWQQDLKRADLTFGQFAENFTVQGLGDSEACVGDRYRIGGGVFEVTQPRVTCYRVGIRMDEPRMAALPVTHHLEDFTAGLGGWGVARDRVHTEDFGSGKSLTPGVKNAPRRLPHAPAGSPGKGPSISFARAGLTVSWDPRFQSLLELAEACDVSVRWSCRTGVCHTCECGLISGSVKYDPEPLEPPAAGNLLTCCSRPRKDLVIDT